MSRNRTTTTRRWALTVPALAVFFVVATIGPTAAAAEPDHGAKIDAQVLAALVQNFDKVEKVEFSWGWIRWLMNAELDPKAQMTFGVVHLNAGQTNPLHVHGNCEEQLFVLSGSCHHRIGDKSVHLKAGDVIRIPAGVVHKATTSDKEPMRAVIVYSSGRRQFEVVEE